MRLCLFSCKKFEGTFENTWRRKAKQMQTMWLCLFWCRQFETTYENAQWRKVKQMQPMWLCLFSGRCFEDTFENAQWKKSQTNATTVTMPFLTQLIWGHIWKYTNAILTINVNLHGKQMKLMRFGIKTHSGEKSNKCSQCEYAFSHAGNLRTHMKIQQCDFDNQCELAW